MPTGCASASPSEYALAALAVLQRADRTALTALLDHELTDEVLAALAAAPNVIQRGEMFELAPGAASAVLEALERDDVPRYRQLHERAVNYQAGRLWAGEEAAEAAWQAAFERLANRLLKDDPQRFSELMDQVRDLPLKAPASRHRRRYFEAVALRKAARYREALEVFEALLTEPELDPEVRGRTLNSQAVCFSIIGQPERAIECWRSSLALWRQSGDHLNEGKVLLNLGASAYDLQEYDQAATYLGGAERIFEEIGSAQWLAAAHNELGLVSRDQGRWDDALGYFEKLLAQRRAEGAQDAVGRGLNNVGEVRLFQGHLDEAQAALHAGLELMTTRVYQVDAHLNLGLSHQAGGDLAEAQAAFQRALDLAVAIGRRDILPHVRYRLGDVLQRQGDSSEARAQFQAAARVIEATRAPLRDEGIKLSLLGRWQQVYEALVLSCLAEEHVAEAFEWAERARARAFADTVLAGEIAGPTGQAADEDGSDRLLSEGVAGVAELQQSLPDDAALLSFFTTGVLDRDVPLLRALAPDNPLRDHLLTAARTLLFVLTSTSLTAHICPVDPNAFGTTSPRRGGRDRFLSPAVRRRLYKLLLMPAEEALAASRVYVAPHGPLHHVPLAALVAANDQPLLRPDGPRVVFVPSATILLGLGQRPPSQTGAGHPCLAVGYDGVGAGRRLRHTAAEALWIADLTGGVALEGPDSKAGELARLARDCRWLHFACHGRFDEKNPLASYLETGPEERLTAREVLEGWRIRADLVTLSACQTGVSRILRGDEPLGLIRAFLYAGARAVLASQWMVEDLPTRLLMQRFYQELQRQEECDPAEALHSVQVWLRDLTREAALEALAESPTDQAAADTPSFPTDLPPGTQPFAHPRFWAAFILVGT